jgi:eukaryotic-like serine/threonine-protein kinase
MTVCKGVQFAHQHFIVHRDLKPSNVMITNDGDVRLLDFGIAKLLQTTADDDIPVTRPLMQFATSAYASPEQLRGERITTASDVYSLGVILYELLTGTHPFRQKSGITIEDTPDRQIDLPSKRIAAAGSRRFYLNAVYQNILCSGF